MSRFAYVNGLYLPHDQAEISIDDRALQFSDGVYEVAYLMNGAPVDFGAHLDRLDHSLDLLDIMWPMSRKAFAAVVKETVRRNRVRQGIVYWQISRGIARRSHVQSKELGPSLIVTASSGFDPRRMQNGIDLFSAPDLRWARRDAKSLSLLPNVLAMREAAAKGGQEVLLVGDNGQVTEAGASTAWMVAPGNKIITHPLGHSILPGITRMSLIELARDAGYEVEERPFSLDEALAAKEVFLSSTTKFVAPVTAIDGQTVGNGAPGEVAEDLFNRYFAYASKAGPENWNDLGQTA